jgi:uncharacterized RDD family membrane protein YckC
MQSVKISTAQHVFIEYQPASVGDRILATLIDLIIIWSYVIICLAILGSIDFKVEWFVYLILAIPFLGYHLVSEIVLDGQTIGKKARNIKVVKLDGSQPRFADYLLRWLLRPVDVMSSGAVAIIIICSYGRGQRLGDVAAGTTVVNTQRRVGLAETMIPSVHDAHEIMYPQAIALSDRDIAIIKETIHVHVHNDEPNPRLLDELARKVKSILRVESSLPDLAFLRTVLKDHAYLTSR